MYTCMIGLYTYTYMIDMYVYTVEYWCFNRYFIVNNKAGNLKCVSVYSVAFESINGVHVYNRSSTQGRESRMTIQSRRELDDRSSMTATPGKYIYVHRIWY